MRNWFIPKELVGIDGLPGTVQGVRLYAARHGWEGQRRAGTKAIEYPFSVLPRSAQNALLAVSVGQHVSAPAESTNVVAGSRDLISASRLNDKQREVMIARLAFCREIERMMELTSQADAVLVLVRLASKGELTPYLQGMVDSANDRKTDSRGLSERSLKRWLSTWRAAGRNEVALAPLRQRPNLDVPNWLPAFLRCYQRPTKPTVAASYVEFAAHYQGEAPSIHAVKRFLKKLTPEALNAGRMSAQELKSLQVFRRRSTANLWPGDVYTADGHKFDAEVINPITGKPYRPEITTVIDVATRRVVGVSVGEAESAFGVLDALTDAVKKCMFNIFYVDNGSGFANDTVREVVDRLGGTMSHSLPYNSQARGLSERGHQTIWVRAAKKLTSYIGADMDKHAGTKVHRIGRKELREAGKSRLIPEFSVFMTGAEQEIRDYNQTPHRGLEKIHDPETGARRHMTPDEAWQAAISNGWEPMVAPADLVDALMRPQATRITRRGEIAWGGHTYFLADLTALHGQEIRLAYDVRDSSQVWAYTLEGELVGAAQLNGNSSEYMPLTMLEQAQEKRARGQIKRAIDKVETITGRRVEVIAPQVGPSAELSASERHAAISYARELEAARPQFEIPKDDVARYRLWIKLDQRRTANDELSAEEARWWERYPHHPDFIAMQEVFEKSTG